jgi:hypothetical protein
MSKENYDEKVRYLWDEGEESESSIPSQGDEYDEGDEEEEEPVAYDEETGKPIFSPEVAGDVKKALEGEYLPAKRPGKGRPKGRSKALSFRKRGRPAHEPNEVTRQTVLMHMALGTTITDIAKLLGITTRTLKKYYREEINFGTSKANAEVARSLFNKAIGGDTRAAEFWLKANAGWSDKQSLEVSGENGTSPVNKVEIEVIGDERKGKKPKQIKGSEEGDT